MVEDRKAELGICNTPNTHPVVPVVVVGRVHRGRIEAEVVRARRSRVGRTRPIVAVVAGIVNRAISAAVVASTQEIIRGTSDI